MYFLFCCLHLICCVRSVHVCTFNLCSMETNDETTATCIFIFKNNNDDDDKTLRKEHLSKLIYGSTIVSLMLGHSANHKLLVSLFFFKM